jgi:HEAT repeat protein
MAIHILTAILAVALSGAVPAGPQESRAEQIVADYLKMPYPKDDPLGEARSQRLDTLSALKDMPDDAVEAIDKTLPQVKDPRQRVELAELLGRHIQIRESATVLCKLLEDPNDRVRWQAIHSLRFLARGTDRTGGQRIQREPDTTPREENERAARQAIHESRLPAAGRTIEPKDERTEPSVEFAAKVEGLVPYLVAAANDEVESNRICALYALADTRDPLAVWELRRRLKDPSEKVRLYAACFLTEYQDASGLTETLAALKRLCRTDPEADPEQDFEYYSQAERLLASFERITGRSFGRVPMNPTLSSNLEQMAEFKKRYNALLATWGQWWTWEPSDNP